MITADVLVFSLEAKLGLIKVGTITDIPPGTIKKHVVGDREILLCNVDGEIFAIDNLCTHDDGSLDDGEVIGCEIECPRHGARFDVRTGEALVPPAVMPVDTFDVNIEGSEIYIAL